MYIAGPDGFTGKQAPSESAVGNYGPLHDADVFASGSRSSGKFWSSRFRFLEKRRILPFFFPNFPGDSADYQRHATLHKFYPAGIAASDGTGGDGGPTAFQMNYALPGQYQTVTLQHLMKDMGTDHLDVVRMDCEGAEWGVLNQW